MSGVMELTAAMMINVRVESVMAKFALQTALVMTLVWAMKDALEWNAGATQIARASTAKKENVL